MNTSRSTRFLQGSLGATVAILGLTAFALPASAQSTFNFDSDSVGTVTTFTNVSNGLSATFSSPFDPGIFAVQPTFFKNLSGNVLGPGVTGATSVPLDIAFSTPVSLLSLNYALEGLDTDSLTLTAFSGGLTGTKVGSATVTGMIPGNPFFFPEGSLFFSSASPFDTVAVTSTAVGFAVDSIRVSAAVPEASTALSFGLLLLLGGGMFTARRKRVHTS